jgi:hypothetical protein
VSETPVTIVLFKIENSVTTSTTEDIFEKKNHQEDDGWIWVETFPCFDDESLNTVRVAAVLEQVQLVLLWEGELRSCNISISK